MNHTQWARVGFVVWAGGIIAGTLLRASEAGDHLRTVGWMHAAAHVAVFAALGGLAELGFGSLRAGSIAVVVAALLGVATEVYEHVAFHGPMEYADVVANFCGVLLGGAVAGWTWRRLARARR